MPTGNDESTRLRSAILRGVYEDNRGIPRSRLESSRTEGRRRGAPAFWALSALLLAAVAILPRLGSTLAPEERGTAVVLQADEAALSASPPGAEIPASGILASFSTGGIEGLPEIAPAELDAERLLDYSLLLDDSVRLSSVFGLEVQTIVIDPGHGGKDPGTIGALGTMEKDIALDIARRLRDRLSQNGRYNILLTRDSDETLSLAERVAFANAGRTDLFISLHVNSLPQKRFNVIETYYYGPPSDPETLRLAEQENRGSHLPAGDFRAMIKKIGDTLKQQESATLAAAIQRSLFTNIKKYDTDVLDVGVKIAPFVVLLGVDAPSVLAEISCITKEEEEEKLRTPAYREKIASFLEEGITAYLTRRQIQVREGDNHGHEIRNERS